MDFRRLKYYRHNSLILVTSGDRQILSAIAQVLAAEKYNFITETSGEKAWEIILQKKPAIVIADWTIPDVSGLALCHRSKSNLEHPELMAIYFVLIVEDANSQQRQIGLDTGVDEFLNDPIDSSELKARLRTGLRLTALTQSLTWTNQRLLAHNDLLDALSLSDSLTKVLSEQAFADAMPKMMMQLKGFGTYKSYRFLSVLIVDIDLFKSIVDSYGEKIGNEAINAISGRLSHSCMANSLIYRHGLDEFVCVTPHGDAASGTQLSQNLLTSIRSHPIAVSSGLLFPLTISIGGVVTALENQNQQIPELSFDELVSLAEQYLLQAQKSGGDRDYIEIFE
ncbi:serine phosphatase RsbU, regulator of sigma subunit [Pseudanabaena sp. lw0831]|uniref:GGDEF domain-containing response regulator n=1 Tax=Pseudanabaena sp. lw0831 TaxID=1357935 RepID=UPI0019161E63|nr:diguanylate cyclase [Pseudanabaena sp. lw0831]GBO52323.1 serine phosphatase RsbU, regulator of sigma subunit [Pseudanabaena sp. lw0831]